MTLVAEITTIQYIGSGIGLIVWIALILWTIVIARSKGRSALGWGIFAFFLPLIALIVVALMPSKRPIY